MQALSWADGNHRAALRAVLQREDEYESVTSRVSASTSNGAAVLFVNDRCETVVRGLSLAPVRRILILSTFGRGIEMIYYIIKRLGCRAQGPPGPQVSG
jgi:hypothetical protein